MTSTRLDGARAWSIAFLLFLAQVINYFDKSVMGLAAEPMMRELNLTPAQYGLVASSFFSLYAVSGVLVGFFVAQHVRSKTLLTILVMIWSLSQLPVVFFGSLTVLVASRIVLGIGEGPAAASAISACHEWFSAKQRNMPTALLMLGSSVGALVAGPVLSYAIIGHGWRSAFLLCSLLGVGWIILWQLFGAAGPDAEAARLARTQGSGGEKLSRMDWSVWTEPTIIASLLVGFCAYWIVGFSVAWTAPLLRTELGFSAEATGWMMSIVSAVSSIVLLGVSFGSHLMLKRNVSSRLARGGVNGVCMVLGGAAFLGAAFTTDATAKLALLALGGALPVVTFTLGPSIVSEVAPLADRSRMLIVIYAAITIAGFFSPIVAGWLIEASATQGYDHALIANAVVAMFGGMIGLAFLQPERAIARLDALAKARTAQ